MKGDLTRHFCLFGVLALIWTGFGFPNALAVASAEEGVEVLTRGPVHEAFAETVEFEPEEGMIVQKAPPEPIEELPPDQKPEGEDVEWIPGYWAWDDEMNDFIWVSGLWRAPPPGREWVPGYWVSTPQGYQWVSGYWARADAKEVQYLPEPPATVESGPNIYAPSADHTWIPGCWIWIRGRYAWRPGYWARMVSDWVWIPAHYEWSPRGYIFVSGYWDYVVLHRGILFAPVYFRPILLRRHTFHYSPVMVINLNILFDSLFVRLHYSHYYFGDYYDSRYYHKGFYPWFSPHARRHGYNPIYAHQRWKHRDDRDWEKRTKDRYRHRRDHKDARPSRKLQSIDEMRLKGWKTKDGREIIAKPLDNVSKNRDTSWRFKPVEQDERKRINQRDKVFREYQKNRHDWETKKADRPAGKLSRDYEPAKVKTPGSPIKAKALERFKEKKAPPDRYRTPRPDRDVEPLRRWENYERRGSGGRDSEKGWRRNGRGDSGQKEQDRGQEGAQPWERRGKR